MSLDASILYLDEKVAKLDEVTVVDDDDDEPILRSKRITSAPPKPKASAESDNDSSY